MIELPQSDELDAVATRQLTLELLGDVFSYYKRMETHRTRVFEVLNALAFATALTLDATDNMRDEVRAWFDDCLDQQLTDIDGTEHRHDG
jgi:hypothetical protein